jgi:hypothetical protein
MRSASASDLGVEGLGVGHDAVDHADLVGALRGHAVAEVMRNSFAMRGGITNGWANHSTPGTPMRMTVSAKNAVSLATMRSQVHASMSPPATQAPRTDGDGRLGDLAPPTAHAEELLVLARVVPLGARLVDVRVLQRRHARVVEVDVAARRTDVVAGREVLAGAAQHDAPRRRRPRWPGW